MFYILAEEILDEIYGKIEAFNHNNNTSSLQVYENSVVNENGAIEAPFHLHDPNLNQPKSLADEILDELYGRKVTVPIGVAMKIDKKITTPKVRLLQIIE